MKSYVTETSFRLVGKGWEVREQLRRMSGTAASGRLTLAAALPSLIGADTLEPQPRQPHTRTKNTRDRLVIPFPSS